MPSYRTTTIEMDSDRFLARARAALREAAEYLEEAAAVSEHPSLGVASSLSHVAAARKAISSHGTGLNEGEVQQAAA